MIYEQNGKSILLIKSSLTAFEQEIIYLYVKDSYKTPQEFHLLVIKHFKKNFLITKENENETKAPWLDLLCPTLRSEHLTYLPSEIIDIQELLKRKYAYHKWDTTSDYTRVTQFM